MLYLTAPPTDERRAAYRAGRIGVMLTPNMGNAPSAADLAPYWAADNGCYTRGADYDHERYLEWLADRILFSHRCLFATAPDVVGDAAATWARSAPTFETLRSYGYYVALVAQDGLEEHAAAWDESDAWDWLFIGGSDAWKDGPDAADCVHEAQLRGKAVHMGRVNTRRRFRRAAALDCDSADGTTCAISPANLAPVANWLGQLDRRTGYAPQLTLDLI